MTYVQIMFKDETFFILLYVSVSHVKTDVFKLYNWFCLDMCSIHQSLDKEELLKSVW